MVDRARSGDRRAWEQLYRAYKDPLYHRVIRPRCGTDADAEDVLVETFVRAWRRLDQFRWENRSIFGWLARIGANLSYDLGRGQQRHERRKAAVAARDKTPPPRPDDVVERLSDRARAREQIRLVLGELNSRYARVLTLRLLEGRERAECASAMNVSLGTFDVLLLRSVRAFRKVWVARFGDDDGGLL